MENKNYSPIICYFYITMMLSHQMNEHQTNDSPFAVVIVMQSVSTYIRSTRSKTILTSRCQHYI